MGHGTRMLQNGSTMALKLRIHHSYSTQGFATRSHKGSSSHKDGMVQR